MHGELVGGFSGADGQALAALRLLGAV